MSEKTVIGIDKNGNEIKFTTSNNGATLYCNNNQLTSLPELPASLETLYCNNNQLTSLPELPASLEWLSCNNNQLTSLPELPASLEWLSCNNNQLTSLPELPASLEWLYCYNNQLTSLPELPASLATLYCFNNPDLLTITWRGKTTPWQYVDGSMMFIDATKRRGNISIHKARYLGGTNNPCYLAECNGTYAHGVTVKQAVDDLKYKLDAGKEITKLIKTVRKSGYITRNQYHLLTGACNAGIAQFCEENGIKGNRLSVKRVLELTEDQAGESPAHFLCNK